MKKRHVLVLALVFLLAVGFASVNTILDLNGNVSISHNEDDFRLEITNLIINGEERKVQINNDKQSFTFTGTGNDSIDYTVTNYSYQYDTEVELVCDSKCNVDQIGNLDAQSKNTKNLITDTTTEITCNLNIEELERTSYAEEMCPYDEGEVWNFAYTGKEQEFIVPCNGNYRIETWGASGGTANPTYAIGGYGAFANGTIFFNKNKKIYINVGGMGNSNNNSTTVGALGGYNGGGSCGYVTWAITNNGNGFFASGGGATHISERSGALKSLESSKDQILIVAGGGGAGSFHDNYGLRSYGHGGNAGGVNGNNGQINNSGYTYGYGGNQNSGGGSSKSMSVNSSGFGYGAYVDINQIIPMCGGGSGYYGGGAGLHAGAGGGSSYIGNPSLIDKAMYCYNCSTSNEESTKTISTTNVSSSPISGYAKTGHGYAKITYLGS